MSDQEEYAPALGGTRAQPEPPPPVEAPSAQAEAPFSGAVEPDFPPELAAFLGPLGRLAELFAEAGNANGPTPTRLGRTGPVDAEVASALGQGLELVLGEALRAFSGRLTPALAAFEGIVDAVEEAITPLLDELSNAARDAGLRAEGLPTGDVDGDAEIVDSIPIEENEVMIPPVDLPPGA